MTTKTKKPALNLRVMTAKQLRDFARANEAARLDAVLEFSRRYAFAVKKLQEAQQDLRDKRNYESDNLVNTLCCILDESDEDWTIDDIIQLIRAQGRVDEPKYKVSPIDDVRGIR